MTGFLYSFLFLGEDILPGFISDIDTEYGWYHLTRIGDEFSLPDWWSDLSILDNGIQSLSAL